MDPDVVMAGVALGTLFAGALGMKGVDRLRRRNSNNGTDRIVRAVEGVTKAVREENKETQRVIREDHAAQMELLGSLKGDTKVLLDRGGRDG